MKTRFIYFLVAFATFLFSPLCHSILVAQSTNFTMARVKHPRGAGGNQLLRMCVDGTSQNCSVVYAWLPIEEFAASIPYSSFTLTDVDVSVINAHGNSAQISNIRFEVVNPIIEYVPYFRTQHASPVNYPAYISPYWISLSGKMYFNILFDIEFCTGTGELPAGTYEFEISISGDACQTPMPTENEEGEEEANSGGGTSEEEGIIIEYEEIYLGPSQESHPCIFTLTTGFDIQFIDSECPEPPLIPPNKNREAGFSTDLEMNLYPNPTNSHSILELRTQRQTAITVQILDVRGKEVGNPLAFLDMEPNLHQLKLPTDHLSPGVYFVQVTTDRGTESLKLIKY